MTASTRYERNLPGILDDLSAGPAPEYLDDVFARTGRMRQRPGWTFPERWLPVADIARTRAFAPAPPWRLIAVALVLIALVLAALVVVGSQRKVAPPFGPARNGEIVYDSAGDLYVGNPESGASRLLVGGPEADSAPGYSPDGTRVAFLRDAGCCPQTVDLCRRQARMDRTCPRSTSSPLATSAWANWTPDSRHLGIIEYNADGEDGQLYLLDTEGREPPRLLAPDMDVRDALAFRPPNGQEIAFRAIVNGKFGVYAINADGTGGARTLLEPNVSLDMGNHAANMVYSADGQRLFYQSYTPATDGRTEGCCQLWVMNADGSDPHAFESVNEGAWTGVPTVSPDGRWVSYWSVLGDSGRQQIRVAPADGSGPAIGTGPAMSDFFPWAVGTRLVEDPDDAGRRLDHLGVPDRSRGRALEHRSV